MKVSLVFIFVGIALIFCAQQSEGSYDYNYYYEQCDGGGYCPPESDHDANECCKYFENSCCTHEQNERLKTIFIVVIVVSVLIFVALIACVVGIIACCCCAVCDASTTSTSRTVVTTGYTPVPSNVIVANTTTNTMRPV